jgi:DNA invertase Pin-like site-specific DNA recombinase
MVKFLLTQIAAVAELEAALIGERTKKALAAAKARGVKLGNPNGARALRGKQTGNAEAVARIKEKAAQRAMDLQGIIECIKCMGITSVRAITEELNRQGIRAPRGGDWHPTAVSRLLARL